jgi:DNA polymerase-3 subunit alpha
MFEWASRRQKEKASGQRSLLDMMTPADSDRSTDDQPAMADVPEWPERERLLHERDALGFFVSGHPLDRYRGIIDRLSIDKIASLTEGVDSRSRPKDVRVAAIVAALRERPLKNGHGRMAILQIEDLTGSCETVVFSKEYSEYEDVLKADRPLLFSGSLVVEGDDNPRPKLRIKEICVLKEASEQNTSQVHFTLGVDLLSSEKLEKLREILDGNKGTCTAFMHICFPGSGPVTVLKLPQQVIYSPAVEQAINGLFSARVTKYC